VQIFPSDKFKLELWIVNGWQSYGMFNEAPGLGWQILWRPNDSFSLVSNEYVGHDTLGTPNRLRVHSDTSMQVKYYDHPDSILSRAAFSVTADLGCENGGGVSCGGNDPLNPAQNFMGLMAYNRIWLQKNTFGLTVGGGLISNPGRYLVLLPPINGANATGTPYFTQNPGDTFTAWDASATFDYMPSQFITYRLEYIHRQSNVPYFAGSGGITPSGGNQGSPGSSVAGFQPDLQQSENRINAALLVRL
jgi:hypothetical protein